MSAEPTTTEQYNRATEQVGVQLRSLAINILRICAGAGKPLDIPREAVELLRAYNDRHQIPGYFSERETAWIDYRLLRQEKAMETSDREHARLMENGRHAMESSEDDVVQAALRLAAARLAGQATQISKASNALHGSTREWLDASRNYYRRIMA